DRFVQGPLPLDRWRQEILADAPHLLIYPGVGMDPISAQLAAQRLAPVQCNSWGHPDTSGFPTLDYYLSSDLMEPPDGQDHYTERLVRLPNLSIYSEPIEQPPASITRQDLGLRSTAIVYWCGQSLFKYLPQFDEVFPRIARGRRLPIRLHPISERLAYHHTFPPAPQSGIWCFGSECRRVLLFPTSPRSEQFP